MLVIPLQPLPNQTLQVQVADQACTLNVYQQAYGLYVDVLLDGAVVIAGVIAENLNRIVRNAYLGLDGDFCFLDTQGSDDPIYTGLGTRWQLLYLAEADLP
jgi:hypothetical protein